MRNHMYVGIVTWYESSCISSTKSVGFFVCLFVCSMEIPDGCHLSTYMDGPYKVLVFGVDEISKMAVMARQV